MIQVQLAKTVNDRNVVDKKLTDNITTECEYVNTSVLYPVFKMLSARLDNANYVYVPYFKRYYFIDRIEMLAGKHCLLHCSVDVLMSYKTQILELNCTVIRQENEKNSLVVDNMIKCNNREQLTSKLGKEVKIYPYSWILATK